MENLIKNPFFLMIGAGVLAFAVANMIMNRKPKGTASMLKGEESSNFIGGCSCNNGQTGSCSTNCSTCCRFSGGVDKEGTRKMYGFEG